MLSAVGFEKVNIAPVNRRKTGSPRPVFGRGGREYDPTKHRLSTTYLGDIHLTNHDPELTGERDKETGSARPRLLAYWQKLLIRLQSDQDGDRFRRIVDLGDLIDLEDSCPWDEPLTFSDRRHDIELGRRLIDEILGNNRELIELLKELYQEPGFLEHVLVRDNHGRALFTYRALQDYYREKMGVRDQPEKVKFVPHHFDKATKTLAIHGYQFDPFCKSVKNGLNCSEVIDILIIQRIFHRVPEILSEKGYPAEVVRKVQQTLRALERVRPLDKVLTYGYAQLKELDKQVSKATDKPSAILEIALHESVESLLIALRQSGFAPALLIPHHWSRLSQKLAEMLTQQWVLNAIPLGFTAWRAAGWLKTEAGESYLSRFVTNCVNGVRSDANQIHHARRFLARRVPIMGEVDFLTLGHTHKPLRASIGYKVGDSERTTVLMNPGSHKPTVHADNPDRVIHPFGRISISRRPDKPDQVKVTFDIAEAHRNN